MKPKGYGICYIRLLITLGLINLSACANVADHQPKKSLLINYTNEASQEVSNDAKKKQVEVATPTQEVLSPQINQSIRPEKCEIVDLSKIADCVTLKWPVNGIISSPFGERKNHFHSGMDIALGKSSDIKAAADGVVVFADWRGKLGKTIVLEHGCGVKTVYSHNSRLYVAKGTRVVRGKRIARMGSTGKSTGTHLHFEVRINGCPIDPLRVLPLP